MSEETTTVTDQTIPHFYITMRYSCGGNMDHVESWVTCNACQRVIYSSEDNSPYDEEYAELLNMHETMRCVEVYAKLEAAYAERLANANDNDDVPF